MIFHMFFISQRYHINKPADYPIRSIALLISVKFQCLGSRKKLTIKTFINNYDCYEA